MRFGVITAARLAYYDRTPVSRSEATALLAAVPHGLTTRLSYTVPAAHRFMLEALYGQILRNTVAAPVGLVELRAQGQIIGPQFFYAPYITSLDNVVGAVSRMDVTGGITLLAGETLQVSDADASTGGTVSYLYSYKGLEFDA